jgi:hypothetical protein
MFFLGSTAPFGGASRLPGQFRFRVLRAITHYSRLPQPSCGLYSPFSFPGVAKNGHALSFSKKVKLEYRSNSDWPTNPSTLNVSPLVPSRR